MAKKKTKKKAKKGRKGPTRHLTTKAADVRRRDPRQLKRNEEVKRKGGKWVKGTPGPNALGRPKNSLDLIALLRRVLLQQGFTTKDKTKAEEMMDRLVQVGALGGKDSDATRAIDSVLDRVHGKPKQTTELTVHKDAVDLRTDEQIVAFLDRQRAKRENGEAEAEAEEDGEEEGEE